MDAKYSFSRYAIASLAATAMLVMFPACNDDFGYQNIQGQQITFKPTAPDTWHEGMSVNENAPTTRCTSVQALSGGDTKLYLHTVVADNPVQKAVVGSRGTPIHNETDFQSTYSRFSLSGICYTGDYPADEDQNTWTTEYAYNLHYTTTGSPCEGVTPLIWPSNGNVRFFAFAPTVEDFIKLNTTDGSLSLSDYEETGSPTLTYTVPTDVTKQVDLMTVSKTVTAATTPTVNLEFVHALTAVQIKCGQGMLAGKITKVTISGIHGSGTQVIGSDTWETTSDLATYTISKEITLPPGENATDKIHTPENTPVTGTDSDNLTFMLLPQTLPQGAVMTIEFTDDATKTERVLKGSIAGHEWQAGKIVTYSISPSSIHISAKLNFTKKGAVGDIAGDTIPYSGVWYDATYSAKAEIAQEGVDTKTIDIPVDKIKFYYRLNTVDDEATWHPCTHNSAGLLAIKAQDPYEKMNLNFPEGTNGTKDNPFNLSTEYNETANCYLVDKAGYYSLELAYGNKATSGGNNNGLKYFPGYDDNPFPGSEITGADDAVLLWQDAPDMVDSVSLDASKKNLLFRIRPHTLTQGNAVVAVRGGADHHILWSWHIWVTPYKTKFYTKSLCYHSTTDCGDKDYYLAQYNLGWCDPHDYAGARPFSLKAEVDMSAFGGGTQTIDIEGTFTQMEYKGSDAGDNTYYQWGRKDPMLGGIYDKDKTPVYEYDSKGNSEKPKNDEFNMENKQVFNQYVKDGYNYSFRKNLGDMIDLSDEASNGVSIGYTIQHPYIFITNSRSYDVESTLPFSYRNHWHVPYSDDPVPYLTDKTHIMFNAWNKTATAPGRPALEILKNPDLMVENATPVTKSVYDPCPPKFKVPPIDAFRGIAAIIPLNSTNNGTNYATYNGLSDNISFTSDNAWVFTYNGQSISFPATGVRDYALRSNEWKTVKLSGEDVNHKSFYKISLPAFRDLTFVSSATIAKSSNTSAYQVLLFTIDNRNKIGDKPAMHSYNMSSNSYGLPVRPIRYE